MIDILLVGWALGKYAVPLALVIWLVKKSGVVRYVPNSRAAVVERVWSDKGSLAGGVIALKGEAGLLPELLRGGLHFFRPFMYRLHRQPIPVIPNNELAYVWARSGQILPPSQALASNAIANNFEDVRGFLEKGGQKGPQRLVLRGGVHPINLAQFAILTKAKVYALNLDPEETAMLNAAHQALLAINGYDPVVIVADEIGIVTTQDGPPSSEVVQAVVGTDPNDLTTFHHAFQDPDAFIHAGGRKGTQYQVLVDGSYYINRMFATVERIKKLVIPVGHVGVVTSNFGLDADVESSVTASEQNGEAGQATSRNKHGELVGEGYKGVRKNALPPGKYPFNTYAGQISIVPTTNLILLWSRGQVSEHKLDANLKEVRLITADAFEPDLPLSVVLHVDPQKAASVVQRFGDLDQLVNQTLDPLVASWFKNIAQGKTATELVHDRINIQNTAQHELGESFAKYDLELVDVVLGTPFGESIEPVLEQLRNSQIAKEQVKAYEQQKLSATALRSLNDEQAKAEQQATLTASSIRIQVSQNEGDAKVQSAEREATVIKTLATANAEAAKIQGAGEGDRLASIGRGEAAATEAKFKAAGGDANGLVLSVMSQFTEAIEKGKLQIVPQTLITGGADGGDGSNALIQIWKALGMRELTTAQATSGVARPLPNGAGAPPAAGAQH